MNRKSIIFFLLFALLCPLFAACDGGTPAETTSPAPDTTAEITEVATTEEITTAAPETTEEEVKMKLRIGSYNIKHAADAGLNLKTIAKVITDANLDIVGIQEVDLRTKRSNGMDQPRMLSEYADMPYYVFVRGIDYQGGQYGTAILSKHPIRKLELINLASTNEKRSVGRFVIDVLGEQINFFNTHLSYVEAELLDHIDQVAKILENYESYIITADFNTCNFKLLEAFHGHRMANNAENELFSFPSTKAVSV